MQEHDSIIQEYLKTLQRLEQGFSKADENTASFSVTRVSQELSPQSLCSSSVVEESLSPTSCQKLSPDSRPLKAITPLVEALEVIVEVLRPKQDDITISRVDDKTNVSYSFLPVMDSSVEIFEDIPETVSATENGEFTKIVIGLLLFASYSTRINIFRNSVIHNFLHADERSRRDCRRKNRLRTTKKEDFL